MVAAGLSLTWLAVSPRAEPQANQSGAASSFHPAASAVFPLKVKPGQRYLEDARGMPFLMHGDAAWSLIAALKKEDVELYLEDRRSRGFNTLLVSLLEHHFASHAPANAYGQQPFLTPGDYSTPNEDYFAHADWVLRKAAEKGFLVLLAPSYTGANGGSEGWYQEMAANGPDKLRQYGRFLGQRYSQFDNILWIHAGDYNPPDKNLVRAIAEGIREFDGSALHSAHCGPETAPLDYWAGEPWLQVNNVYTYGPVYLAARAQYSRPERMPFFLIESAYENEHGATEQRVRMQSYQALLSGAAGQVFGNNPVWHFDGPGLFPAPVSWKQALGSRSSQSMRHLMALFAATQWWLLVPDIENRFLTASTGSQYDRVLAAMASDASFAIVYVPNAQPFTLDLGKLKGPHIMAQWYDPASGTYLKISEPLSPAIGSRSFKPRGRNSAGFGDWVLLLESRS